MPKNTVVRNAFKHIWYELSLCVNDLTCHVLKGGTKFLADAMRTGEISSVSQSAKMIIRRAASKIFQICPFQHTTEELQTTCRTVYIQSVQVPELQKATIPVMQTIPHSQVLRPSNILNIGASSPRRLCDFIAASMKRQSSERS